MSIQPYNRLQVRDLQSSDLVAPPQSDQIDDIECQLPQQSAEARTSRVFQSVSDVVATVKGSFSEVKNEASQNIDLLCDEEDVVTSPSRLKSILVQEPPVKAYVNPDFLIKPKRMCRSSSPVKKQPIPRKSVPSYTLSEKQKAKLVWFVKECGIKNIGKFKSYFPRIKGRLVCDSLKQCYMQLEKEGNLSHYLQQAAANTMLKLLTDAHNKEILNISLKGQRKLHVKRDPEERERENKILVCLVEAYGNRWTKFLPFFPEYTESGLRSKYMLLNNVPELLQAAKKNEKIIDDCLNIGEALGFDTQSVVGKLQGPPKENKEHSQENDQQECLETLFSTGLAQSQSAHFNDSFQDDSFQDDSFQNDSFQNVEEKFDALSQGRNETAILLDLPEEGQGSESWKGFYFNEL